MWIKYNASPNELRKRIEASAKPIYSVSRIVATYMNCIEEIINIDVLLDRFEEVLEDGKLSLIIAEIVSQSKLEFNYGRGLILQ